MDKLFIKPEYAEMLTDIFKSYCPEAEIWAYGSRLNGNAHEGSDLDLAVKSFNSPDKNTYELKEIIRESNVPFLVDLHDFNNLPESFQKEILRNYVVFFKNDN